MLLSKLGMEKDQTDHRVYRFVYEGRLVARTFVSTGSTKYKTLGDDLIAKMAKQLHVTSPFFVGIVKCSNSREDYVVRLRQQGLL